MEDDLNHRVVARYLPGLDRILHTTPYAVIYLFQPTTSSWEKSGVEGSLFICQFTALGSLHFALVILNRRGLDNWIVEIVSHDGVQVTDEYIMLAGQRQLQDLSGQQTQIASDADDRIWGIWVFEEAVGSTKGQRDECRELITACARKAEVEIHSLPHAPPNGHMVHQEGDSRQTLLNLFRHS